MPYGGTAVLQPSLRRRRRNNHRVGALEHLGPFLLADLWVMGYWLWAMSQFLGSEALS
jgi:hypothetical protein